MFGWLLLAIGLVLVAFPLTFARTRVALVERIEALARELTPMRILFWIAVFVAAAALGQVLAADLAWIAAVDVATYLEVFAAVMLTSAAVRVGLMRRAVVALVLRATGAMLRPVKRAARAVRVRAERLSKLPPPDEDAGALLFAH